MSETTFAPSVSRTQSHSLPGQPAPAAARGWETLPCFSQKVARPKGDSEGGARPPARRSDLREDHSERERESTSSLLTPQDTRSSGTAIPTPIFQGHQQGRGRAKAREHFQTPVLQLRSTTPNPFSSRRKTLGQNEEVLWLQPTVDGSGRGEDTVPF